MSAAEGGRTAADPAHADAGVAPELRDWKMFDVVPTRCKGSAWESESRMSVEMVTQIHAAIDTFFVTTFFSCPEWSCFLVSILTR